MDNPIKVPAPDALAAHAMPSISDIPLGIPSALMPADPAGFAPFAPHAPSPLAAPAMPAPFASPSVAFAPAEPAPPAKLHFEGVKVKEEDHPKTETNGVHNPPTVVPGSPEYKQPDEALPANKPAHIPAKEAEIKSAFNFLRAEVLKTHKEFNSRYRNNIRAYYILRIIAGLSAGVLPLFVNGKHQEWCIVFSVSIIVCVTLDAIINPKAKSIIYSKNSDKLYAAEIKSHIKILDDNNLNDAATFFKDCLEVRVNTDDTVVNGLMNIGDVTDMQKFGSKN